MADAYLLYTFYHKKMTNFKELYNFRNREETQWTCIRL